MSQKFKKGLEKIKVAHDFSDLKEGVDYVMTIKDKNVLEADEDLDILENEILNKNQKLKLSEKLTLEKEQDQYLKDQILAKYDEKDKIKGFVIKKEDKSVNIKNSDIDLGIELNEENKNNFSKEELSLIKEKLKNLREPKKEKKEDLKELSYDKTFTTDYLTPEEFKPKEFKRKKMIPNNKVFKSILLRDEEENKFSDDINHVDTKPKQTKNNILNDNDEYEELNKFLEKQRNLVNKNKINATPEEKIKEILEINSSQEVKEKAQNSSSDKIDHTLNGTIEKSLINKKLNDMNSKGILNIFYLIFLMILN